jgi:hypothetical protein
MSRMDGSDSSTTENPYRAPGAAIDLAHSAAISRRGWKAYFWVVAASAASSLLFLATLGSFQILDALDFVCIAIGLTGVFGYAHRRALAVEPLWKLWLPLQITWDALIELVLAPLGLAHVLGPEAPSALETALGYLFLAPYYIALYRYAFRSAEVWGGDRDA